MARRLTRRPVSSNWPAATPTGHFLSGPSCFSETAVVHSKNMDHQMHTLQNQVKSKVRIIGQWQKLNCHRCLPRRPVSSNWPAATPTGHFLSGPPSDPSARHVLVRLLMLFHTVVTPLLRSFVSCRS